MGFSLKIEGDWKRAGLTLRHVQSQLLPAFKAEIYEDGQFVLEKLQGHIDSQDLGWTPLSQRTVALKNGDSTIYVETGELRDGLVVRRIKSSANGATVFVGASPWKNHKGSGLKMSQLMIYLEYGTGKMPARPLIRPTLEEVHDIIEKNWEELFKDICEGG